MNAATGRCPWCGATLAVVHVHGHGQCAHCGANVDPCCAGAGDEGDERDGAPAQPVDPRLFARLFADLGGRDATVAVDALLYSLTRRLGVGLDEAREVLDAGVQLGLLEVHGAGARLCAR